MLDKIVESVVADCSKFPTSLLPGFKTIEPEDQPNRAQSLFTLESAWTEDSRLATEKEILNTEVKTQNPPRNAVSELTIAEAPTPPMENREGPGQYLEGDNSLLLSDEQRDPPIMEFGEGAFDLPTPTPEPELDPEALAKLLHEKHTEDIFRGLHLRDEYIKEKIVGDMIATQQEGKEEGKQRLKMIFQKHVKEEETEEDQKQKSYRRQRKHQRRLNEWSPPKAGAKKEKTEEATKKIAEVEPKKTTRRESLKLRLGLPRLSLRRLQKTK